jgi:hypothetical protein
VRDVCPGQAEDARVALEIPVGELRQLAVVVRREVVADFAQLLLDDVEVVDEPFRGRGDRSFVLDRLCQPAVGLQQDASVLGDPRPDGAPGARPSGDRLGGRERLAVLLQALDAEELGDDRLRRVSLAAKWAGTADRPLP